ncbi:MAG TPA: hypothetical protein VHC43_13920 [Mycobacteriales bacterium]|nr:hypothetical protein [Mycobacteriales bacterium]
MATLLVSYDLNKPGQGYEDLIARLKSFGAWWHYLDSTWLIASPQPASEVRDALLPLIDDNDELLVINVTGDEWASWMPGNGANTWLEEHI